MHEKYVGYQLVQFCGLSQKKCKLKKVTKYLVLNYKNTITNKGDKVFKNGPRKFVEEVQ